MKQPHNHSKRRREQKMMLKTLRDPKKREEVLRELMARTTPLRNMVPVYGKSPVLATWEH